MHVIQSQSINSYLSAKHRQSNIPRMRQKPDDLLKQLKNNFLRYEELRKKGRLQLKRKVTKQFNTVDKLFKEKEFMDFDFSNYPYYYNYPPNLFNLQQPEFQRDFIEQIFAFCEEDFTSYPLQKPDLEEQHQLVDLLTQRNNFKDVQATLVNHFRWRHDVTQFKTAYIQDAKIRLKYSIDSPSYSESDHYIKIMDSMLQKLEIERRSYLHKILRLNDEVEQFHFGKPTHTRVSPTLNEKGQNRFIPTVQQMQFSNFEKTDFVAYARYRLHWQRVMLNFQKLYNQLECMVQGVGGSAQILQQTTNKYRKQWYDIIRNAENERSQKAFNEIIGVLQKKRKDLMEVEETFDIASKLSTIDCLLKSIGQKQVTAITENMETPPWTPSLECEFQQVMSFACKLHFGKYLNLTQKSKDLFSIKMNNYISVEHRLATEGLKSILSDCFKDYQLMEKALHLQFCTIFEREISSKLIDPPNTQLFSYAVSTVDWQNLFSYNRKANAKQQIIADVLNRICFFDPTIKALINLLDTEQSEFRKLTTSYCQRISQELRKTRNTKILEARHFTKVGQRQKLIQMIARNINFGIQQGVLTPQQKDIQNCINDSVKVDVGLLGVAYNLIFVKCVHFRNKIVDLINAQFCLQKSVVHRTYRLQRNNIPFEVSDSFLLKFSTGEGEMERTPNSAFLSEQEDVIVEVEDKNNKVPFTLVKCENRMDPSKSLGTNIIYSCTLKQTKKLLDKIERLCCFYIEKHESQLPETRFSEVIDRYKMFYHALEAEVGFQYSKYCLMKQYFEISKQTYEPRGLLGIYERILWVKGCEYPYELEDEFFLKGYKYNTVKLLKQSQLLSVASKMMRILQQSQNEVFLPKLGSHNMPNEIPQVSIIYYSQETNLAKQSEEPSLIGQNNMSCEEEELNLVAHQDEAPKNQIRIQKKYNVNQYLLKNNFKDILQYEEQEREYGAENAKRDQLIGKFDNRHIDDSVLGVSTWLRDPEGLLERIGVKFYEFSWNIVYLPLLVDELTQANTRGDIFKVIAAYDIAIQHVNSFEAINIRQLQPLSEDLLSNYLDKASQTLIQLPEKLADGHMDSIYKQFDSDLIKKLVNNKPADLTQYRGLYLCINFLEAIRLSELRITTYLKTKFYYGQIGYFIGEMASHCKDYKKFFENRELFFRPSIDIDNVLPYPEIVPYELLMKQTLKLYRYNLLFQFSNQKYFRAMLDELSAWATEYTKFEQHMLHLINYKITTYPNLKLPADTLDLIATKQKLASLQEMKSRVIDKVVFFRFMKNRELFIYKIKTKAAVSSKDILERTQEWEKALTECANMSLYLYDKSKMMRYHRYLEQIKVRIKEYLRMMPFTNSILNVDLQKRLPPQFQVALPFDKDLCVGQFSFPTIIPDEGETMWIPPSYSVLNESHEFSPAQLNVREKAIHKYMWSFVKGEAHTGSRITLQKLNTSQNRPVELSLEFYMEFIQLCKNLVLFLGLVLSEEQLFQLRKMIYLKKSLKELAFVQNATILNPQNIKRLRSRDLSSQVFERYEHSFKSIENLKEVYKDFINDMRESLDLAHQEDKSYLKGIEYLNRINRMKEKLLFTLLKELDLQDATKPPGECGQAIFTETQKPIILFPDLLNSSFAMKRLDLQAIFKEDDYSEHKRFFTQNVIDSLHKLSERSPISARKYLERRSLNILNSRKIVPLFEKLRHIYALPPQHKKYIKERLQELDNLCTMYTMVKGANREEEVIDINYQAARIKELVICFGLTPWKQTSSGGSLSYLKQIEVAINVGEIHLNPLESKMLQYNKNVENSKYYSSVMDKLKKIIFEKKVAQEEILKYFYRQSEVCLQNELELLDFLEYDAVRRKQLAEQKCKRDLVNSVLIPKIKVNPFLSSPLCVDKYFIPHTAKLAYIQSFLNKLRNKVLQVQLIDNQFGFLIKSNDLEDCVSYLSRSFIGFAEKEFKTRSHRLVVHLEAMEAEAERLKQSLKEQRAKNNVLRHKTSALMNSMVFSKTNNILLEFFSMRLKWQDTFDAVKKIQQELMESTDEKYNMHIKLLQAEKKQVQQHFNRFKNLLSNISKKDIKEAEEKLIQALQSQVEDIINYEHSTTQIESARSGRSRYHKRSFMQTDAVQENTELVTPIPVQVDRKREDEKQEQAQAKAQYTQTEELLKVIAKQKILNSLKIVTIQERHRKQLQRLQEQLTDKDKVFNSYLMEKRKAEILLKELSLSQDKTKSLQTTVAQLRKDLQDQQQKANLNERLISKLSSTIKTNTQTDFKISNVELPPLQPHKSSVSEYVQTSEPNAKKRIRRLHTQISNKNISEEGDFKYQSMSFDGKQLSHSGSIKYADESGLWKSKYEQVERKNNEMRLMFNNLKDQLKYVSTTHDFRRLAEILQGWDDLLRTPSFHPNQTTVGQFRLSDLGMGDVKLIRPRRAKN